MTDVGSHHFVKGARYVLVPQPSSDPNDPLVSCIIPLANERRRSLMSLITELEPHVESIMYYRRNPALHLLRALVRSRWLLRFSI